MRARWESLVRHSEKLNWHPAKNFQELYMEHIYLFRKNQKQKNIENLKIKQKTF